MREVCVGLYRAGKPSTLKLIPIMQYWYLLSMIAHIRDLLIIF